MTEYEIAEKFVSINGEGARAGELAVFIRFRGCNLSCSYCDTRWASGGNCPAELLALEELTEYAASSGVANVTLTGGEPLLQAEIYPLIESLMKSGMRVEIETNGSVDISEAKGFSNPPSITMDFKSPSSGMCDKMLMSNYDILDGKDTVKFVCGSSEDLEKAYDVICKYSLTQKCAVYISPVFGNIDAASIVEFMKDKKLNGVNLQLQLHKYIWSPDKKGV